MALFAIMHVFAYPWKEYDVNRANLNEAGTSNPMNESSYQGGKLGIKAYLDAFNPWDMIKAIGRGFKWLFVGHRKREEDSSYKQDVAAVPLQNIHPTKGGRYEQIDDTTADDEHEMYEPYDRHATDRIPLKGDHSDQGTAIPVRHYEEDGLIHVLQQPQSAGTTHVGFNQDTGYHAPTSAQTAYMPEESQYYNPRTR